MFIVQRDRHKSVILKFVNEDSGLVEYVEVFEKIDIEDTETIEDAIMSYLNAINDEFVSREMFRRFINDILQSYGYSFEFIEPFMSFYI